MSSGYDRLRELTRLQLELLGSNRFDEAIAVGREWEAVAGSLPAQPPAGAGHLLEESLAVTGANAALIAGHAGEIAGELEHVARGRRAIASYGATAPVRTRDARA